MEYPNNSQAISVKEARKLLGTKANNLSDDQVREIIDSLSLIARKVLIQNSSKNREGVYSE